MTIAPKKTTSQIRVLTADDAPRAASVIVAAFAADPIARWVYPDAHQYLTYFPVFVRAFAGQAFVDGTAHATEDGRGTALWLAPGAHADEEALGKLLEESVSPSMKDEVYGFIEKQVAIHPRDPHWYLPLLGVDPSAQGRGAGSLLLAHALKISDRQGLPAYLEATSAGSKALYERHGFKVLNEIQFGSSPSMWPMLRQPRKG